MGRLSSFCRDGKRLRATKPRSLARTAQLDALGWTGDLSNHVLEEQQEGQMKEGMALRKSGNEGDDATPAIKACPKLHVRRGSLRTSSRK